jgi:hypothetical protein
MLVDQKATVPPYPLQADKRLTQDLPADPESGEPSPHADRARLKRRWHMVARSISGPGCDRLARKDLLPGGDLLLRPIAVLGNLVRQAQL